MRKIEQLVLRYQRDPITEVVHIDVHLGELTRATVSADTRGNKSESAPVRFFPPLISMTQLKN